MERAVCGFQAKDFHSTLSHFIGFCAFILLTPIMLVKAAYEGADTLQLLWYSIFMLSLILLYGASSAYHAFDVSPKTNAVLKRLDHAMIFVLIAGSYTPVCMIVLKGSAGATLCLTVWGIAFAGIFVKMLWIDCPKWFSSVFYIAMGWACVFQFSNIYRSLPPVGFILLLTGGIIYTLGGLVYPLKIKGLSRGYGSEFGMHEIFHIFILTGSLCHYLLVFLVITRI